MNIYLVTQISGLPAWAERPKEYPVVWVTMAKTKNEAKRLIPYRKAAAYLVEILGVVPEDLGEGYWGNEPRIVLAGLAETKVED